MRRNSEHLLKAAFFAHVREARRRDKRFDLVFSIPSGRQPSVVLASRLKAEGVEPGVPNVFCAIPSGDYHWLWLKLKSPGASLSHNEAEKISRLREAGYRVEVARDAAEAFNIVEEYLNGSDTKVCNRSAG